jgi:hypothetical protein
VHATLLDTAMGYCGCYTGDPNRRIMALTLSMTVNYLSQVKGIRLIAEATQNRGRAVDLLRVRHTFRRHGRGDRHGDGRVPLSNARTEVASRLMRRARCRLLGGTKPHTEHDMAGPRRHWREMTTRDFSDADTSDWIAVLPIAAIEQHGPHLPVGVDALIADAMVERCAAALPEGSPATFLPVQQVCKSNEHIAFPGTLTLDWDTAIRSWLQIGESVARAGLRKMIIVTSHGGNVPPMEIVARELRQTHAMAVATTAWTRLTKPASTSTPRGRWSISMAGCRRRR